MVTATVPGRNGTGVMAQATTVLRICITAKGATLCANSGQSPARSIPVQQAGEIVSFSASVKNAGQVAANGVWFSYGSASAARLENLGDIAPGQEVTRTWQEAVTPGPPAETMVWIAACAEGTNAEDGCAWLAPWIGEKPPIPPIGGGGGISPLLLLLGALGIGAVWFFSQYEVTRE